MPRKPQSQRLPLNLPTGTSQRQSDRLRQRPTLQVLAEQDPNDLLDLVDMMEDALIAGLDRMRGSAVLSAHTDPDYLAPAQGRPLWTLATVDQVRELDETLGVSWAKLATRALQPTHGLPGLMQAVSPRLAWMSTMMSLTDLHRVMTSCATFWQTQGVRLGSLANRLSLTRLMGRLTYGVPVPAEQVEGTRHIGAKVPTGYRNRYQAHAINTLDGVAPLAAAALSPTMYPVDLGARLKDLEPQVLEVAKNLLSQLARLNRHLPEPSEVLSTFPLEAHDDAIIDAYYAYAVPMYLTQEWTTADVGNTSLDPRRRLGSLVFRALLYLTHDTRGTARVFSGETLMALSLASGIPVSSLLRYAVKELKRRTLPLIDENGFEEIHELINQLGHVRALSGSARQIGELDAEVAELQKDFHRAVMQMEGGRATGILDACSHLSVPELGYYAGDEGL